MHSLHALDWIGLSLLAYGLTAGFLRGFSNQFSRFLVLLAALACSGWLAGPVLAQVQNEGDGAEATRALGEAVAFLVFAGLLLLARRALLGWLSKPKGGPSRLTGALFGVLGALLFHLVLGCSYGVSDWKPAGSASESRSVQLWNSLWDPIQKIPEPPRPVLLQEKWLQESDPSPGLQPDFLSR